ncbi:MAG: ATP-dependent Clp protease adaptor ClpS [Bowdeniella nasicola]|nr:ATP-dependent Clp protease adaptor ClpS [Bowdeniella nasicola]
MSTAAVPPNTRPQSATGCDVRSDAMWQLVVWNDEVNLFSYVIYVLQNLFHLDHTAATTLAWRIHKHGHAVALCARRDDVEARCRALQVWGINATMRRL